MAAVRLALDLAPFAGIAFLWFIDVLRTRLVGLEDQFFSTILFASGLLFTACLFAATAITWALIDSVASDDVDNRIYFFGRHVADVLINLFAMKMAAVFMFSTCTIGMRTSIFPRWVAVFGYSCGMLLLLVIANWRWITLVFPIWMMLTSGYFLYAEFGVREVKKLA